LVFALSAPGATALFRHGGRVEVEPITGGASRSHAPRGGAQ